MSESLNYGLWRAGSSAFDVDAFLREFPALQAEAEVWREGEPYRRGRRVHDTSGFNLTVADTDAFDAAMEQAQRFFSEHLDAVQALRSRGVASVLDFAIMVGTDRHYIRSVHLSVAQLRWLADLGIALEVTAYPCSTDAEPSANAPDEGS
jgi:hypothetical protein